MSVTTLANFIVNHWLLCSLTLFVVIALVLEEFRDQGNSRGLSCEQLVALINHKKIKLLDLRKPESFKSGHIRGSVNINKNDLEPNSKVEAIVLINETGKIPLSFLKQIGKNGYFLIGGIDAWRRTKLPLEK